MNKRLTKADITNSVKEVVKGLTNEQASKAVATVFQAISNAMERGDEVTIVGFGTFKVTEIPQRQGYNPQTGEAITIAAHNAVKFSAGKQLKEKVNK